MSGLAAVIGWPVRQSLSPRLHTYWLKQYGIDGAYVALPVQPEDFRRCVETLPRMGFNGANVTVPHKEAAFALAHIKDDDAIATGAVNTLVFGPGGIEGFNTDVSGFAASIVQSLGTEAVKGRIVAILGAGGAARGVTLALTKLGVREIRLVNRTKARTQSLITLLGRHVPMKAFDWNGIPSAFDGASLLVNTTSLGMTGKEPLDLSLQDLPRAASVADIVYHPLQTELLRRARAEGRATVDGLGMLMHQAVPAFARWFGVTPEVTPATRAELEKALAHV